jgi:hypothetical protein
MKMRAPCAIQQSAISNAPEMSKYGANITRPALSDLLLKSRKFLRTAITLANRYRMKTTDCSPAT